MADPQGNAQPDDSEYEEPQSFLPPFANEENKDLDRKVQALEKLLAETDSELEANTDRINIMGEHVGNVQQELKFTQAQVESKNKETKTESHLKSMAERELGRLKKDIDKTTTERTELKEKVSQLQNLIYKNNDRMDQFRLLMGWNQEELEQWALAERQKEEDNQALEKYRHKDSAKMKELQMILERVSKQVVDKKEELDNEVVETQAAQVQLDKAADDFRKLHEERQDLIRQWDEAVEAMRYRDTAIAAASERFAAQKGVLRELQQRLDAQNRFLQDEVANNKELDDRIAASDREVGKGRDRLEREQKRAVEYGNQVEVTKSTLAKAAQDLSALTSANAGDRDKLSALRIKLDTARKEHHVMKRKLETEFSALDTIEGRAAEMALLRKGYEAQLRQVIKQHEELKKEQYKRNQKLFELRSKERELISEISGGQGQNKNLAARIHILDEQVVRQLELLYNVEFQQQQMERKVARAGGVRSEEETRALNARIEKLTAVLEGVNAEHSMLSAQAKAAEDDLQAARRANVKLAAEKAKVDDVIATLQLENEMVLRQVKSSVESKEKALVDKDVLALEVKRLRDLLAAHADEVFSLENRKAQLKMSMEERKQEIEVHRDGLRGEVRLLRDDVHRITLELQERLLKAEKLQSKFETISSKHRASSNDEGDGEQSQAYFVIKAAQEREELQREGDELDVKIRRAEKETAALEATLAQLMGTNTNYNQSFKKVESKQAFTERASLREKLDKVYDKLKWHRNEESALAGDLQVAESRLSNLGLEQRALAGVVDNLTRQKAEAERVLDEQRSKLARATRNADKLRSKMNLAGSPQDKDIQIAEVRDTTHAMLLALKHLSEANPSSGIAQALASAGIDLPSEPGRAASSTGSHRASRTSGDGSHNGRPMSGRSHGSVASSNSQRSVGSFGTTPRGAGRPPVPMGHRGPGARPGVVSLGAS